MTKEATECTAGRKSLSLGAEELVSPSPALAAQLPGARNQAKVNKWQVATNTTPSSCQAWNSPKSFESLREDLMWLSLAGV